MLIIGLVLAVIVLLIILKKDKKDIINKPDEEHEEPCEEIELKNLAVIYKGKYLISNEVVKIPYNTPVSFEVKGFDITGTKEVCIYGNQVIWGKSCPSTHWVNAEGLVNSVYTSNKTLNIARNVWVKYTNGITFKWKVEVI